MCLLLKNMDNLSAIVIHGYTCSRELYGSFIIHNGMFSTCNLFTYHAFKLSMTEPKYQKKQMCLTVPLKKFIGNALYNVF